MSKVPIAVVSADWHLDRQAWIRYPNIKWDSYYSLYQIVDATIQHWVPLLAAGDLFDKTSPDPKSVWEAHNQMSRLHQIKLPIYYIQGQHERSVDTPWLGIHDWPKHINKQTIDLSGYRLYGLDFHKPELLMHELPKSSGSDILMCHQVWRELMQGMGGTDLSMSICPADKMIITGDRHKHIHFNILNSFNKQITVLSPGSIAVQSMEESSDKAVFILYDDLSFDSYPIKTRKLFKVVITSQDDLDRFINTIDSSDAINPQEDVPDYIAKNIIHVRYNADIKDVYNHIVAAVDDRAHLFVKVIPKTVVESIPVSQATEETISLGLEGNLHKVCPADSDRFNLAKILLSSESIEDDLLALEDKFLEKGSL